MSVNRTMTDAKNSQVEVAIAILFRGQDFLMQLRDDIPNIVYPGHWGLFGGHLEPGETPEIAVVREVIEEIGYQISDPVKFGVYEDKRAIRHVFVAPINVNLRDLTLMEGWDMDFLTQSDIERGQHFSARSHSFQPLVSTAQRILLDFIESKQNRDSTE